MSFLISVCVCVASPSEPILSPPQGNVVIPGLNVIDCSNITEVFNCLEAGLVHRHTAALHNNDPSTSHAIFSLILEHQWTDADGKMKYLYSRMNFVDLGGSERLMQFGYSDFGLPSEDSFFLNTDLKALSNVIHCLADQSYSGPIPYKESRLTHILKDAFGGNSLSLMVCCLSPSAEDFDATFNTLKYGGLARYILNCPAVNMAIQNSAPASSATLTPSSPHTTLRVGLEGVLFVRLLVGCFCSACMLCEITVFVLLFLVCLFCYIICTLIQAYFS
ncbi:Kinesin-like protein kif7 [Portunus trituberculatus]|uniref:Kinesin-like protein kif7 n=1 Tax=Portunus trituberculatus TaxID=210409 RepID=A0A5B7DLQ1_PORTR|nr:Kinesin-like protein kif7 [Portunus trituberculatus]